MSNKLIVVKPFNSLQKGDTFVLNNGKYICSIKETTDGTCVKDNMDYEMTTTNTTVLSVDTAKSLIESGYLKDEIEKKSEKTVFDEMDGLLSAYYDRIANLDEEFKDAPTCLKNEAEVTTLNLIKVLRHLKTFKNA